MARYPSTRIAIETLATMGLWMALGFAPISAHWIHVNHGREPGDSWPVIWKAPLDLLPPLHLPDDTLAESPTLRGMIYLTIGSSLLLGASLRFRLSWVVPLFLGCAASLAFLADLRHGGQTHPAGIVLLVAFLGGSLIFTHALFRVGQRQEMDGPTERCTAPR